MQKLIQWLRANSEPYAHWATVLAFIAAGIGGYFAYEQLELANEQKRWQNYNEMNVRYAELYKSITPEIASGCRSDDFEKLQPETKRWVRQYFDLYSEEYWLYLKKLIPEEMWTRRIYGGVRVNLNKYPALVEGYRYWKGEGSFTHPDDFQSEVERAIADAKLLPQKTKLANSCAPEKPLTLRSSGTGQKRPAP
jgi:hypothetical protein